MGTCAPTPIQSRQGKLGTVQNREEIRVMGRVARDNVVVHNLVQNTPRYSPSLTFGVVSILSQTIKMCTFDTFSL